MRVRLQFWQTYPDFVGVRDAAALAKTPEAERAAWQKLWADMAALQKRCEEPPAAPALPPEK